MSERLRRLREIKVGRKAQEVCGITLIGLGLIIAAKGYFLEVQAQGGSPDLVVRNLTAQAQLTGDFAVRGEIFNQGNSSAEASVAAIKFNERPLTPTVSIESLPPGGSQRFEDDFRPEGDVIISQTGGFIEVTADSTDLVPERREDNNSEFVEVKDALLAEPFIIYLPYVEFN